MAPIQKMYYNMAKIRGVKNIYSNGSSILFWKNQFYAKFMLKMNVNITLVIILLW